MNIKKVINNGRKKVNQLHSVSSNQDIITCMWAVTSVCN